MSVGVYYNKPHDILFRTSPFKKDVQKVKRQLFGPIDHEATQRFVAQELEKQYTIQSERWNFDFKRERTLNPNGAYDWRPATPFIVNRSMKRRPDDADDAECDNEDLYCLPENMCEADRFKRANEEDHNTPPKNTVKTQSLITDFMPVKKNSLSSSKKTPARPAKLPRLAGNELKS